MKKAFIVLTILAFTKLHGVKQKGNFYQFRSKVFSLLSTNYYTSSPNSTKEIFRPDSSDLTLKTSNISCARAEKDPALEIGYFSLSNSFEDLKISFPF